MFSPVIAVSLLDIGPEVTRPRFKGGFRYVKSCVGGCFAGSARERDSGMRPFHPEFGEIARYQVRIASPEDFYYSEGAG